MYCLLRGWVTDGKMGLWDEFPYHSGQVLRVMMGQVWGDTVRHGPTNSAPGSRLRGLFVSNRGERCGVYQFGRRLFGAIETGDEIRWHYAECDTLKDMLSVATEVRPDIILLNYHPSTLAWAADEDVTRAGAIVFSVFHEAHQHAADWLSPKPFQYLLCPDPTLLPRNPICTPRSTLYPTTCDRYRRPTQYLYDWLVRVRHRR